MRLFSIIQWHHFAYMVIGLALLGYGISGSVVSIFQQVMLRNFGRIYTSAIALFAVSAVSAFLVGQQIPFNAEEILWDERQIWFLSGLFILLSMPFFFAATAICLAFMHFRRMTAQIYAADLIGAGFGSLGVIFLLFWLFPQKVLTLIGLLSVVAAMLASAELPANARKKAFFIFVSLAAALITGNEFLQLRTSPYKGLQQVMRISGAEILEQRSSPMGLISVVENNSIPFRHAPGLSLNAPGEPPAQLALFTDGDGMSVINRFTGSLEQLSFLDFMPSALPYHLRELASVLIVGGGGGSHVLQSLYHRVPQTDVLEMNPQVVELVNDRFGSFSGRLYSREGVNTHVVEVRDYLGDTQQQFDLVQLALMDTFNSSSAGLHALHESYLYTVEAVQLYLQHLKPDGYLALTRWVNVPPRDSLKLLNTVITAMQRMGIDDIARRLMLIRGWQTITLVIKNGVYTDREIHNARQFSGQRSFDIAWLPEVKAQETNRYNRLDSAVFYQATQQLLSQNRRNFVQQYKFDLNPASDDRPYFYHFFKWRTFTELLGLRNQGGMSLIEWGYLVLLSSLLIALVFSIILILLPLWFFYRRKPQTQVVRRRDVFYFFLAIGLAFLMIEIAFMQKFIQFLHHPIYSIATTLTAFLVFAGVGSQLSVSLVSRFGRRPVLRFSILGIFLVSLLYVLILGQLFDLFSALGLAERIILVILLVAPLAFAMGIPFPLALGSLADHAEDFIPWAWGINGCASVISASLATLLAINFGFNVVILIGVFLYLTTLVTFPSARHLIP